MTPDPRLLAALHGLAQQAMADAPGLAVLGLCGAQGSGKSTLIAALASDLEEQGTACAVLSLDDLYLGRSARAELADRCHPLFATRGVPGTHDVALGLATLDALAQGEAAVLPRFDKGRDEPLPPSHWPRAPTQTRLLLLEGWCLGASPQDPAALAEPVNGLERDADPHGLWRGAVNRALAGSYAALFARITRLALLAAPDWPVVQGWRDQQEQALRDMSAPRAMTRAGIARFVQHYERLTRHILSEMPQRADLVVRLGPGREVLGL